MIEEKKKVLYSNKPEFKKLVMQYAKKNGSVNNFV